MILAVVMSYENLPKLVHISALFFTPHLPKSTNHLPLSRPGPGGGGGAGADAGAPAGEGQLSGETPGERPVSGRTHAGAA